MLLECILFNIADNVVYKGMALTCQSSGQGDITARKEIRVRLNQVILMHQDLSLTYLITSMLRSIVLIL